MKNYKINGDSLELIVPGNATTGYTKDIFDYDSGALEYLKTDYKVNGNMEGASGEFIFHFKIKIRRNVRITIAQYRPWLPAEYTLEYFTIKF